uniref:LRRGT00177 n=1 Tax=Rattus norvegicus TaxID=10116 RepID=Q6QI31_RAT|nr:LRRGT00177 [Rattus norvegicus]|eukprot:NP_001041399.1 uncharacterized protein LOC498705 [Rattus norvegicus]
MKASPHYAVNASPELSPYCLVNAGLEFGPEVQASSLKHSLGSVKRENSFPPAQLKQLSPQMVDRGWSRAVNLGSELLLLDRDTYQVHFLAGEASQDSIAGKNKTGTSLHVQRFRAWQRAVFSDRFIVVVVVIIIVIIVIIITIIIIDTFYYTLRV